MHANKQQEQWIRNTESTTVRKQTEKWKREKEGYSGRDLQKRKVLSLE